MRRFAELSTAFVVLVGVLLVLCIQGVESTSVVISGGRLELDIVGWNVTLYVKQFNENTKEWRRLDSFRYSITPVFIVETWDEKDLEYGNRPHNYTLPTDGGFFTTLEDTKSYPNGATANVYESRAKLPNGATFVMKVDVFDRDTYKDLNGYRLPLTNQTLKTTFRVFDWPQFQTLPDESENGLKINVSEHRSLSVFSTFEMVLLAPVGSSNYLSLPAEQWPFFVFSGRNATNTLANPAVVPSLPLTEYLFTFKHRYFDLKVSYLEYALRCALAFMSEDQCIWSKLNHGKFQEPGVADTQIINLVYAQIPPGFDESVPGYLRLPMFFGFVIRNETTVEWDPNLDIMFSADFDIAAAPGEQGAGNIAVAVAVPVALVVIAAGVIGVIVWRRNQTRMERQFFARNSLAQAEEQQLQQNNRNQSNSSSSSSGAAPSKSGGGWSSSHTPDNIRNTL